MEVNRKSLWGTAETWKGDYKGGSGECASRQGEEEAAECIGEAAGGTV